MAYRELLESCLYALEPPGRDRLLHLMGNHRPGRDDPTALLEVVDAYLRLNPQDAEVLEARERLVGEGRTFGA
jgi:hypothetical protein